MRRKLLALATVVGLFALAALMPYAPTRVVRAQSSSIDTTKWYKIVNKLSGKCLDVSNASLSNGINMMQGTCNGGANQTFKFESMGSGYYRINIEHSHKCVDQFNAVTTNGANIGQIDCHLGFNQQWLATYSGGYWTFNARHSGKNMEIANGSLLSGALVVQHTAHGGDNQQFEIYEVSACTDNDQDTWCQDFDCDENDAATHSGADNNCESGYDRDCNGFDDFQECFGSGR